MERSETRGDLREGLQPASQGSGALLQRDYWCVIRDCRLRPPELIEWTRSHFQELPPETLARFQRTEEDHASLEIGDELEIRIPVAGKVRVRVVHRNRNSFTVATLQGHPIAGRITFGAYPNVRDDVVFHIRSRARSGSFLHRLGFLTAGEPMQSTTWTDLLDRLAHTVGEGVIGVIHEETREISGEGEEDFLSPTYLARGD